MLVIKVDVLDPESREGLGTLLLDVVRVPARSGRGDSELCGEKYLAAFLGVEFEPAKETSGSGNRSRYADPHHLPMRSSESP